MARSEIHKRFGLFGALWWRFAPGLIVAVKWPTGWTEPEPAPGGGFIQTQSSDPNDHYRSWLEKYVGRQGWDWNWRISQIGDGLENMGMLDIKFRRGKEQWASYFLLKYQR